MFTGEYKLGMSLRDMFVNIQFGSARDYDVQAVTWAGDLGGLF